MAHKKAGGSTANVRDSQSKRLGVKAFAGEKVGVGDILVRQRGTRYVAGNNVFLSKDHSLHAGSPGKVNFVKFKRVGFDGRKQTRTRVEVLGTPKTEKASTKKVTVKK